MPGGVYLTKCELVVILVVENIEKVGEKGMNFLDLGKFADDQTESVVKVLLCVFDLSHIKITDSRYLITTVDDCGCFSLGFRENDIGEILTRWHHSDSLKIVLVSHNGLVLVTSINLLNYTMLQQFVDNKDINPNSSPDYLGLMNNASGMLPCLCC